MNDPQSEPASNLSAVMPESGQNPVDVRSMNNRDIQQLVDFWNSAQCPGYRFRPITIELLEQLVFAKPYFDPQGFFLAWNDGRLAGFAHAGFGPNDTYSAIDYRCGCIPMVCYNEGADCELVLSSLLDHCEQYLLSHGVQQIQLGAIYPMAPFYLGLLETSDLPGVFLKETTLVHLAQSRGYRIGRQTSHFRRDAEGLEWAFSQEMRQMRQQYQVCMDYCPTPSNWWNAIAMNAISWSHFSLLDTTRLEQRQFTNVAHCSLWLLDERSSNLKKTIGMSHFYVLPALRQRHLALFMLTEILRGLSTQNIGRIQVQINSDQFEAINLVEKRGFEKFDESAVFVKDY